MPTRSATTLVSLLLFASTLAMAGDAVAQRVRDSARQPDREQIEQRPAAVPQNADVRRQRGNERDADHRALSDAVRRVERRTGGQVLSAERVPYDGREINRVKIVDTSGRVRVYVDDPPRKTQQISAPTRRDDN
ncbi:MAG: PepSY domain-containing protein [Lysobacter sp.]